MTEARYWTPTSEPGGLRCTLCPHGCALRPGASGRCGARANVGGRLHLLTWGRSSGFCIDPVEKKPFAHVLPGSASLSFGGFGCNLSCACCQNWEISRTRGAHGPVHRAADIAAAARREGCRSVAITYNEPLIALEWASEVAAAARAEGLRVLGVSAGYLAEAARPEFFACFDAVNLDLKAFSDDTYRRLCGARLAPVLETLKYGVRASRAWIEITTLVIPGVNDGDAEIAALAEWIAAELSPEVPLHLSAFHPAHRMRDRPPTPAATLVRARDRARAEGLKFVYVGNLAVADGGITRCPGCGRAAIARDGAALAAYGLDDAGRCRECGTAIPGVFDGPPGDWGNRRRPLAIPANS
ncbi:Radical SAM domain protein [uncultured Alphaproteobacteria bacterium]|uniref:Radical SAM domain protein n=1 Tax=uncultured Alphaproteobacteria bacterium TaxID=91750 RepID=A0A212KIZ0_9PROT|nr:Radical SAM domain protein [uncultured Alphaproteobacteria bacterium]